MPCMFFDKRKSPNILERGKWRGPAQVVMVESTSIIWVTHMNRLLRCARDNLRPVTLHELNQQASFVQQASPERLKQLAEQLSRNLHERSGLFQFSDLSEIPPEEGTVHERGQQPEEEPSRRQSQVLTNGESNFFELPHQTPIPDAAVPLPDTPAGSVGNGSSEYAPSIAPNEPVATDDVPGDTPEGEFQEGEGSDIVDNALIIEHALESTDFLGDEDTLWTESVDTSLDMCSFEFTLPKQQVERYLQHPDECTAFLTTAAKRPRSEVQYSKLTPAEKDSTLLRRKN